MKLKVIYTPQGGLKLVHAETGEAVEDVTSVTWTAEVGGSQAVVISLSRIEVDAQTGESAPSGSGGVNQ